MKMSEGPTAKDFTFDREEYLGRMRRVETAMDKAGLDAFIAYSVSNQPGPVAYLSGYEPGLGLHYVSYFVIVPGGSPRYALVTNALWDKPKEKTWTDVVVAAVDLGPALVEFLPTSVKRLGVAGYKFFPMP